MPAVTIRNLPEDVHRALKVRAAGHNRSAEAEIREILKDAVMPKERIRMGSHLAAIARAHGLHEDDAALFERPKRPATPMSFD